jgi:hypothetical protein
MKIPSWFINYRDQILNNIHPLEIIQEFCINHDISKPYDMIICEDGKKHFPNHSENSKKLWLERGGNPIAAHLMELDMCFHTESKEEILRRNLDIKDACTLLISSLAEIHANAELFGGIESTSFKIKYKKIDKIGKFVIKHYFGVENELG